MTLRDSSLLIACSICRQCLCGKRLHNDPNNGVTESKSGATKVSLSSRDSNLDSHQVGGNTAPTPSFQHSGQVLQKAPHLIKITKKKKKKLAFWLHSVRTIYHT